MEEEIISFETSKLAKEKGLISGIMETSWYKPSGNKAKLKEIANYEEFREDFYYAPTQSLLQKWLREVKDIHISLIHEEPNYSCNIGGYDSNDDCYKNIEIDEFLSYEEALEKGLQEALKLI